MVKHDKIQMDFFSVSYAAAAATIAIVCVTVCPKMIRQLIAIYLTQ